MIIIKEMSKQPIAYESIFAAFVPQIIIQKTIDIQKKIAISKAKNRPKPVGRGCPKFYQILSKSQSVRLLSQSIEKSLVINALRHFLVHRQSVPET